MDERNRPTPLATDRARILDALQAPVVVIDNAYHVIFMNAPARARFGDPDLEATDVFCHTMSHDSNTPCQEAGSACPVRTVFETGEPARVIHHHRKTGGGTAHEEIMASPLFDDDGAVAYVVEEVRGATELLESREIIEHMRSELDLLRGILPTCASCKRIRTPEGEWEEMESYVGKRSSVEFSHGLCPRCVGQLYPGFGDKKRRPAT